MRTIMDYWYERAAQLSGHAVVAPPSESAQALQRAGRGLTTGIVAGLLLGSTLLGTAAMRLMQAEPDKPAHDFTSNGVFGACGDATAVCPEPVLQADAGSTFVAALQFANVVNAASDATFIPAAHFPAAGGGTIMGGSSGATREDGSIASGGYMSASGSGAGILQGVGVATPQLLAITNLPGAAGPSGGPARASLPATTVEASGPTDQPAKPLPPANSKTPGAEAPSAGLPVGNSPDSKGPHSDSPEMVAEGLPTPGAGPGENPPAPKKPKPLFPVFPADLTPVIARVISPELPAAPPESGPALPEGVIPPVSDSFAQPAMQDSPAIMVISIQAVPAPATLLLLGLGLACMGLIQRKK